MLKRYRNRIAFILGLLSIFPVLITSAMDQDEYLDGYLADYSSSSDCDDRELLDDLELLTITIPGENQLLLRTSAPDGVTGNFVTLRTFKEEYLQAYYNMLSPTIRQCVGLSDTVGFAEISTRLRWLMQWQINKMALIYAIFDNNTGLLIGIIQIVDQSLVTTGQLACWIHESYWGSGYFQEALSLISQTYFAITNAPGFTAHVKISNKRSYGALKKFGMEDTGLFYEQGQPTRYTLEFRRFW